ncbi:MAG: cytochrome o ubiquinol oxidase subunit III [Verrucomicrobia bacterium]|nr:cytochrome o ubiquinol oxidase subunit III [Verrucomicrobiota bacterium]
MTVHHYDLLDAHPDTQMPDPHQGTFSKATLGFWIYLMTDCLLFASLFCTYAVLHNNTFGGPSSRDIFDLKEAGIETAVLLCSTLTCGFSMLSALKDRKWATIIWLAVSFLLGASFVGMELREFTHLVEEGHSWQQSAFLSSFFTLVGTHGFHVSVGLLWMAVMMVQIGISGITVDTFRRLAIFSSFWHFLDLIWIFIFTFVYLMGVL